MSASMSLYEDRDLIIKFREAAFTRQDGLCYWCKRPMIPRSANVRHDDPMICTADHLVWKSRGGTNAEDNIVAACHLCNTGRHPPSEWPWLGRLTAARVSAVGWGPWSRDEQSHTTND